MINSQFTCHSRYGLKLRIFPFTPQQVWEDRINPEQSLISNQIRDMWCTQLQVRVQLIIHRIVLLLWIGEIEFAQCVLEENKYFLFEDSLEDLIFRLIIYEKSINGHSAFLYHPEFTNRVIYGILDYDRAFKLSTASLSDLLKMDKPSFSSIDGLVNVDFNKRELERIAKIIPQQYHQELRLPLILLRSIHGYGGYELIGNWLETYLLNNLLKLSDVRFEKYAEERYLFRRTKVNSISTLKRRRFNTIYKIFPE